MSSILNRPDLYQHQTGGVEAHFYLKPAVLSSQVREDGLNRANHLVYPNGVAIEISCYVRGKTLFLCQPIVIKHRQVASRLELWQFAIFCYF
jgi:hypothetical protein